MSPDERLTAVLDGNLEPWWRCVHPPVPMGVTMTIHECRRCEGERAEVAASLAAALTQAGWVHRDDVADRFAAAIRLVQPDHLTPMGARQLRAVVNNFGGTT